MKLNKNKHSAITHYNYNLSQKQTQFFKKKISFSDAESFFPNGYETLFLLTYIIVLPYIAGLIFLLLFFSNLNISIMQSIYNSHSFFLTWCVGYEILAITLLIVIFKKFLFMKL
jgi:hypothetical protein